MALTKAQIFEAADEIDAGGKTPTMAAVRKMVGGGSYTTINEAMKEWHDRRRSAAAPLRDPVPPAVADRMAELGQNVWAAALEMANGRLASERDALEASRQALEQERAEAVELADQLVAELEEAKARNEALEAQCREAEDGNTLMVRQLAELKERLAAAEARTEAMRPEIDRAHAAADKARAELADAQRELLQLQEQRKRAALQANAEAQRLTTCQAERDAAKREADRASAEREKSLATLAQAREEVAGLKGRVDGLEKALASFNAAGTSGNGERS